MQRKLPETSHFFSCSFVHIQKPWQRCRAALGPFRSLRARRCQSQPAPKPSANLLPNSFCYPTTTTQHRPPGSSVTSVKTHRCKDTMGDFFFFYCISQHKDVNKKKNKKGCRRQTSVPATMQPSSRMLKYKRRIKTQIMLQNVEHFR